jgi:polysaccharide transporter, PST family
VAEVGDRSLLQDKRGERPRDTTRNDPGATGHPHQDTTELISLGSLDGQPPIGGRRKLLLSEGNHSEAASKNSQARRSLAWLLSGRGLQLIVAFTVGALVARYLGPDELGVLAFAMAYAGLFAPVALVGAQLVVRDLAVAPADGGVLLGSSSVLALGVSTIALGASVALAGLVISPDVRTFFLILILSGPLLLAPFKAMEYWFEATLQAKYLTIARSAALLVAAIGRLAIVVSGGGLYALAIVTAVEQLIAAILVLGLYASKRDDHQRWSISWSRIRRLAVESGPLLVASIAVVVHMRIDQVMLGLLSDDRQAGLYFAVVRLSEAVHFVPVAVVATFAPVLARLRLSSAEQYRKQMSRMLGLLVLIAGVIAVPFVIFAGPLVSLILGSEFSDGAPVLSVHVAASVFVFLSVGTWGWVVNESLQRVAMYCTLAGTCVNVVVNVLLIPPFGAIGAATATLVAQIVGAWLAFSVHPLTRPVFGLQSRALLPWNAVRTGLDEIRVLRASERVGP